MWDTFVWPPKTLIKLLTYKTHKSRIILICLKTPRQEQLSLHYLSLLQNSHLKIMLRISWGFFHTWGSLLSCDMLRISRKKKRKRNIWEEPTYIHVGDLLLAKQIKVKSFKPLKLAGRFFPVAVA